MSLGVMQVEPGSIDLAMVTLQEPCPGSKSSVTSSASGNVQPSILVAHRESTLHGFDVPFKVRKPYTISKQRVKWTEEEHQRFLKAIKLNGRAWPQIEEYVGTKTAVQIRSHAQKFFTKEGSRRTERSTEPIEIPPPRPKRKPLHPYPRKLVQTPNKSTLCFSFHESRTSTDLKITERGSHSPTSVQVSQISTSHAKDVGGGCAFSTSSDSKLSHAVASSLIKDILPVRIEKEADRDLSLTLNLGRTKLHHLTNMKSADEYKEMELPKNKEEYLKSKIIVTPLRTIKLFGRTVFASSPLEESDGISNELVHTGTTNLVTCNDPPTEPLFSIRSQTSKSVPHLALSLNGRLVSDDIALEERKSSGEKEGWRGISRTGLNCDLIIKTVENPETRQAYVHYTTEFRDGLKIYKREFLPYKSCSSNREVAPLKNHKDDRRNQHIYL